MDITVIGSGTVVPSPDRVCSAYYVESGDLRMLFDCGPGAVHHMARFERPWSRLTHVVLTHFHTDHIGDLPILFFALKHGLREPRQLPLTVIGPEGVTDLFGRLAGAFGDHLRDPGFPLAIREVGHDDALELGPSATLRIHATPHTEVSVAYRLEVGERALGYTGDTGPSPALGAFFRGVDLLIAECSLPDEIAIPTHLSPSSAADLGARAEPGRLLLTHVYPQLDRLTLPGRVRNTGWSGAVDVAQDGMRLSL